MDDKYVSLEAEGEEGFVRLERLKEGELSEKSFLLPEGTKNIRLLFEGSSRILHLTNVQGVSGPVNEGEETFCYDLSFTTDALRLGHNLFLLEKEGCCVYGEDFRFLTRELRLKLEVTPLSKEGTAALAKSVRKKETEARDLEEKWLFQRRTYDEKVQEVERLERDKVALNETVEELRGEVAFWRDKYHEMEGSSSWKVTAPLRNFTKKLQDHKNKAPLKQLEKSFSVDQYAAFPAGADSDGTGVDFALWADISEKPMQEVLVFVSTILRQTWKGFVLYLTGVHDLLPWLYSVDPRIRPCEGIPRDEGKFLSLLDTADLLAPETLELCAKAFLEKPERKAVYTDSVFYGENPNEKKDLWFKPDFSPDYLMGMNFIRGFYAAKTELLPEDVSLELLRANKNHGYILLTTAKLSDREVCHLPGKLFFEKQIERDGQTIERDNPLAEEAIRRAAALRGWELSQPELIDRKQSLFHPVYNADRSKKISVILPNKDHAEDLQKCVDSLKRSAEGYNLEILIVENNSAKKETFDLYRRLETESDIRILHYRDRFNFSEINNFAVKEATGDYLLLLNNDMTVLPCDLPGELLMYAQRPDVGAVGAKLLYPDDTVQHAGVIIGLGGVAAHSHKDYGKNDAGYMNRLLVAQDLSAVTAACLMMRRSIYEEIGGMDPGYEVAFNDADFCMRIRSKGYHVVFTPFALLTHYESKSRGSENTPEKAERFESEVQRFKAAWPDILKTGDPYYNPNLTTAKEDFSIRPESL